MQLNIEQCQTVLELLENKSVDNKYKKEVAILLLNSLRNIKCSNCMYQKEVPSFVYGIENKCDLTDETSPDCNLIAGRMGNCPYNEHGKKVDSLIKKMY